MPSAHWTMSFLDILTITGNQFCGDWGPHMALVLVSDKAADAVLSQKGHDSALLKELPFLGSCGWVGGGGGGSSR